MSIIIQGLQGGPLVTQGFTPGNAPEPTLVAPDDLAELLGDYPLTDAQQAMLDALNYAASRAIRKHCNRYFNRRPSMDGTLGYYDGLYTLDWPSRKIVLRQFPVNRVKRIRTNPTVVLSVVNTDATTNQDATASLILSGVADVDDVPPTPTGMELSRVASGVEVDVGLGFNQYPTIGALATAINALGAGWQASVSGANSGPGDFSGWPCADLIVTQGPMPALGFQNTIGFALHADSVPCQVDLTAGIVHLSQVGDNPFTSLRFGTYLSTDLDDVEIQGSFQGIRIVYDAGWDVVPNDVQFWCVQAVKSFLEQLKTDSTLKSERDGAYGWEGRDLIFALPENVLQGVAPYRNRRA
jgi:hypothetical protein